MFLPLKPPFIGIYQPAMFDYGRDQYEPIMYIYVYIYIRIYKYIPPVIVYMWKAHHECRCHFPNGFRHGFQAPAASPLATSAGRKHMWSHWQVNEASERDVSNVQNPKELFHDIGWLRTGFPVLGLYWIKYFLYNPPYMKGSIIPELIIKQQGF